MRVVQAFAREDVEVGPVRGRQLRAVREPHALGEDLGLVPAGDRAGRVGHHRPGARHRRLVGPRGPLTVGTVAFFVLTLSNLFEPVQQLSQLFNMVQSAGAGPTSSTSCSTSGRRPRASGGGRPAGGRRRRGRRRVVRLRRRPRVLRDVSLHIPPACAWRWSGPTGAGSRRWPSWSPGCTTPPRDRAVRGRRPAGRHRRLAAGPHRRHPPGGVPVQRDHPRQRAPGPGRSVRRGGRRRAGGGQRLRPVRVAARRARHRGPGAGQPAVRRGEAARVAGPGGLADPALLVLDEATSSLDPGTEALVEGR